jgi:F0F1-type ATP synthase membrane subunit b/b'
MGFLTIDGTFWVQLINFGIFFLILKFVFLDPVGRAIAQRRAYIDGVQHSYDQYRREARELRAEADQKRAAARRTAEERFAQARVAANDEATKISADFGARATKIADDARATVEGEVAAARAREPELAKSLGQVLLDRAVGALTR